MPGPPAPPRPLLDRNVLLCVSGGIAAYKSADLVRRLRDAGANVRVAMTAHAQQFVGTATFQALSGQPVHTTLWDGDAEAAMGHLQLAHWASHVVIAPATANTLARLAHGIADDLVSTVCLATTAPLLLAPAMNHRMWLHPATQANVAVLRARDAAVIGPDDGPLAEDASGPGRMAEPMAIVAALAAMARPPRADTAPNAPSTQAASDTRDLADIRIVISAGPTFEDLDPVRYIGNRSSGKMGFALAAAAARRGADVLLVAGPVALPTPPGVMRIDIRSALQLRDAVLGALPADIYIGAAAVADFAPRTQSPGKIRKTDLAGDGQQMQVELVRTPDVLAQVAAHARRPRVVVGFAAETSDVERYARGKLERKQLDMIVANRVGEPGSGFEGDDNTATLLWRDGERALPRAAKTALADDILDAVHALLDTAPPA